MILSRKGKLDFVLRGPVTVGRANLVPLASWLEFLARALQGRGHVIQIVTGRPTSGTFTSQAWARTARALTTGALDVVGIATLMRGADDGHVEVLCTGFVNRSRWQDVVEVRLSAVLGASPVFDEPEFVEHCVNLAEQAGLPQGLAAPYQPPFLSAYETKQEAQIFLQLAPLGIQRYSGQALERFARGTAWGLWLTEKHLNGLGGRERVRSDAPVARVLERPTGLWLELTASPWDISVSALDEFEQFLLPILPSAEQIRLLSALEPVDTTVSEAGWFASTSEQPTSRRENELPVRVEWLTADEGDIVINVHLSQEPSPAALAALTRFVEGWYDAGASGRFPPADTPEGETGSFHFLSDMERDGLVVRWWVDAGAADVEAAIRDLVQGLSRWAAQWESPITVVRIGQEPP